MIAVITADITNSTKSDAWQQLILPNLEELGSSPKDWNIYRGDSIQIRMNQPAKALYYALRLKSSIRQINSLDIRIAIGIGNEIRITNSVTQNTGSAYVNSGRLFESLPQNLAIKTDWNSIDVGLNAGLNLFNTICEQWTIGMANFVHTKLIYPDDSQEELALKLNTTQSNVSRVLARANYPVLQQYLNYFEDFINSKL